MLILLASFFLCHQVASAQVKPTRRILILNEVGPSFPIINLIDQGIRMGLDNSPYKLEFYHEYLETTLFPDPTDQEAFREFYVRKYQNRMPDVIITVGPSPLRFMVETHKKFFAGVPIVFCLPNGLVPGSPILDSDFTGVETDFAAEQTLRVALRLQPGTEHVVIVGGVADYDRQREAVVKRQLEPYVPRLDISYLTNLAMPALLEQLQHLPKHTVVLYTAIGRDAAGTRFSSNETGPMISAAANAPVFGLADINLGHGEVGGDLADLTQQGTTAAGLALRILGGEKPQDIPHVRGINTYEFDWKAMQRWGFKENNLPPGSVLINRQPSFWQQYRGFVTAAVLVLLTQTLAILALLWQRAKRRKIEAELRESEQRFRLVTSKAPVMIWMSNPDQRRSYFNQPWLEFTGRSLQEELGNGWVEGVQAEDLRTCLDTYTTAFDQREPFQMEYRLRRHDGEYRWIFDYGVPRFNVGGSFSGYIGSASDVTERKLAEEALSVVSRRLIEAHEEERSWIARELHDDVNQRLALLNVNLERLRQGLPPSEIQTSQLIEEACNQLGELASDIQSLSHRLHSSKLEYLGLAGACAGFCRELTQRQNVEIEFHADSISKNLSEDVSLCLFRVLQEALQNAIKHSGARLFEVSLTQASNEVQLSVHDSGVGFDREKALSGHGLGLTSMKERLKLVDGHLFIDSTLQCGTTVHARVPVRPRAKAAGAGV